VQIGHHELQELVEIHLSIDAVLNLLDSVARDHAAIIARTTCYRVPSIRDDTALQDSGDIMKLCK
jgi:hypothetical protein